MAHAPAILRDSLDYDRRGRANSILPESAAHDTRLSLTFCHADGSEAEKSGNGLRIFAKFLYDHGYTREERFTVDTLGGRVTATLTVYAERVSAVRVDMGRATINRSLTHLDVDGQRLEVA